LLLGIYCIDVRVEQLIVAFREVAAPYEYENRYVILVLSEEMTSNYLVDAGTSEPTGGINARVQGDEHVNLETNGKYYVRGGLIVGGFVLGGHERPLSEPCQGETNYAAECEVYLGPSLRWLKGVLEGQNKINAEAHVKEEGEEAEVLEAKVIGGC
jgi:hypothetical protein